MNNEKKRYKKKNKEDEINSVKPEISKEEIKEKIKSSLDIDATNLNEEEFLKLNTYYLERPEIANKLKDEQNIQELKELAGTLVNFSLINNS
jgi:hypothetical protein